MREVNVLSLFGGVECGYKSFEDNEIQIKNYYSCEIDKYAKAITKHNINNHINIGDALTADFKELKNIDIVIGGSPCTYWSIAKKDREITNEGIGYELFMQFSRALKETSPKYFIYENNHSIHKDIKESISKELGVDFITINSSNVSAQNRKRCYWTNIPNITQPEDLGIILEDILEEEVNNKYYIDNETVKKFILKEKITKYNGNNSIKIGHFNSGAQADRVYTTQAKSVTLSANGGGRGAKTGLYCVAMRGRYGENGKIFQNIEIRSDNKTNTLTTVQKDNMLYDSNNFEIRRLTPKEAERLQTLPDDWTRYGIDEKGNKFEISDSQRLKCVGNGWTRKVITHLISFI